MIPAVLLVILCCGFRAIFYTEAHQVDNGIDQNEVRVMKHDMWRLKEELVSVKDENRILKEKFQELETRTDILLEMVATLTKIPPKEQQAFGVEKKTEEARENIDDAIDAIVYMDPDTEASNDKKHPSQNVRISDNNNGTGDVDEGETEDQGTHGLVTKRDTKRLLLGPEPVAFSVTLSKFELVNLEQGQLIDFDSVLSNLGNAFDKLTGLFSAPTQGWYVFSLTIMTDQDQAQQLDVVVNGVKIFRCHSEGNELNSASRTVVTHVNNGDRVWVQTAGLKQSGHVHGYGHTSFTGFLLYAD